MTRKTEKPARPVGKPKTKKPRIPPMRDGERQVAPSIDGIRRDHVARYEWAARHISTGSWIIDMGCGIGYGSKLLASGGLRVLAVDNDPGAIAYGGKHYDHPRVTRVQMDANTFAPVIGQRYDAAVCFEMIEHLEDPRPMLKALAEVVDGPLFASVPNETVFPWKNYAYHFRHYTKAEFATLLQECGWEPVEWYGQEGPESEVERHVEGRTLIAVARKSSAAVLPVASEMQAKPVGPHIAIVALGPSAESFVDLTKRLGGTRQFCDQVWTINALGDVLKSDLVFHMDDVRIQEIRAAARPDSNIAAMLRWMRTHPGPIMTSRKHADYPGLVEFPLEDVIANLGHAYFNNTGAYAVAYAIHVGARKISLFGFDFTYPNAHDAEKGRACVEFWLGVASQRGIELAMSDKTTLMDAIYGPENERLYGYDTLTVDIAQQEDGSPRVSFQPKDKLPTAAEIEAAYDHAKHPNPLVKG